MRSFIFVVTPLIVSIAIAARCQHTEHDECGGHVEEISGVWRLESVRHPSYDKTIESDTRTFVTFVDSIRLRCNGIRNRIYTSESYVFDIVGTRPDGCVEVDLIPAFYGVTGDDAQSSEDGYGPDQLYFFHVEQERRVALRCLMKVDGDVMTFYQPYSSEDSRPDSIPAGRPQTGIIEVFRYQAHVVGVTDESCDD